jgi:diacylglycerol O-acyltransferase/trehalose O-mycolyltransferase
MSFSATATVVLFSVALAASACGAPDSSTPAATTHESAHATTPAPTASPTAPPTAPPTATPGAAAHVLSVTTVDDRVVDLQVESPSIGTAVVRLILPEQFEEQPDTRWPVLFMFHGATSSPSDWVDIQASPAMEEMSDVLVVMPDAGVVGFYSDWWNHGFGGPPAWETFHLVELPALLESEWHAGDTRAALGVSMGGYGAFEYATRRPGFFAAVASISGLLAPSHDPRQIQGLVGSFADDADDLWGDPEAQASIWAAHDPTVNAEALAGTALFLSYGNGRPGELNPDEAFDPIEAWIAPENDLMVQRLASLNIEATVDAYGPGTHSTPYFVREFERAVPLLSAALHPS